MSNVTALLAGKLAPQDFINLTAADIKKDVAWFQALPFAKTVESWALDMIYSRLAAVMSPTFATLIVHEIKAVLGINDTVTAPAG